MKEHSNSGEDFSPEANASKSFEPSIYDMADLVLESLEEGYRDETDSFEVYAQKLKSHIHSDPHTFRHRFQQGYKLLVDLLQKPDDTDRLTQD